MDWSKDRGRHSAHGGQFPEPFVQTVGRNGSLPACVAGGKGYRMQQRLWRGENARSAVGDWLGNTRIRKGRETGPNGR